MDPPLLTLLLLPLASGQLTETLRHGSIFGWLRAWGSWATRKRGLLGLLVYPLQIFTCAFCLSHWTAAAAVGLAVGTLWAPELIWVLVWLAVIRVSNFISDAWHPIRRTADKSIIELLTGVTDEELEQEYIRRRGDPFEVGAVPEVPQQQGGPPGVPGGEDLQKKDYDPTDVLGGGGISGVPSQGSEPGNRGSPPHPDERHGPPRVPH